MSKSRLKELTKTSIIKLVGTNQDFLDIDRISPFRKKYNIIFFPPNGRLILDL